CGSGRVSPIAVRHSAPPGPRLLPHVALQHMPPPVAKFPAIIFTHGIVANGRRNRGDPGLERGAPLGRIEPAALGLAQPSTMRERASGADDLADSLAAARAHEVIGVVP